MITITNYSVSNIENAIRGMRNPMDSWVLSDSVVVNQLFKLGDKDLKLAKKLCVAGEDHRKFMRQIFVSMDILAPLYWWKEFDTYKVGTVSNSCSTMHTIHKNKIECSLFSCEKLNQENRKAFEAYIHQIEKIRCTYNESKDLNDWVQMVEMLPSSFNQLRTCTFNFEVLLNIYKSRHSHKLDEWKEFCKMLPKLDYFSEITGIKEDQ